MSVMANHPLRLPGKGITGVQQVADSGLGPTAFFVPMEDRSWSGQPIGLSSHLVAYPILWMVGSLAGMAGLSEVDWLAIAHNLVTSPTGKRAVTRPRAVIYGPSSLATHTARDACVSLESELQERGILAAARSSLSGSNSEETDLLRVIIPPNSVDVLLDSYEKELVASPGNFETVTEVRFASVAEPADWVGGEILYLMEIEASSGGYPYSSAYFDTQYGDYQVSFPDRASDAASEHLAFAGRYDRVKVVAVITSVYEGDAQLTVAGNFNRAALASAASAVSTVEVIDLGDFATGEESRAAATAEFEAAIRDFFGM